MALLFVVSIDIFQFSFKKLRLFMQMRKKSLYFSKIYFSKSISEEKQKSKACKNVWMCNVDIHTFLLWITATNNKCYKFRTLTEANKNAEALVNTEKLLCGEAYFGPRPLFLDFNNGYCLSNLPFTTVFGKFLSRDELLRILHPVHQVHDVCFS